MSRLLHDTPASRVLDDDDRLDEREILARDEVLVRSLQEGDLGRVVRIDERITDRHRLAYYERKFSEALRESGVRISLVAETDGLVAGFVMARVDYGELGQADVAHDSVRDFFQCLGLDFFVAAPSDHVALDPVLRALVHRDGQHANSQAPLGAFVFHLCND